MTAETGHAPSRAYRDRNGNFHLNGASFYNDAEQDIADSLEQLNTLAPTEIGYLDGALPGTATASKVVIYDAAGKVIRNVAAPAAAGANQGAATALTKDLNAVTGATGTNGVALPAAAAGAGVLVINTDPTNALLVYPVNAGDDAINSLGANNAYTIPAGAARLFVATSATQWYTDATLVTLVKMADLARGSLIVGGASNRPTALDANNSGQILVGDGTDLVSVAVSGDATLSAAGALTIATAPATGKIAVGLIDFNATGDCTSMTIGTQVYTRGVSDPPNGVWAEGASPAASATALAGAIEADVRAGADYNAIAVDTTVWVFAKVAGVAGNVTITKTGGAEPDVNDDLVGGVAIGAKKTTIVQHTVTTEEATQIECHIPLPFVPTTFIAQVRTSAGAIVACTDLFTIETGPDRIRVLTTGAVHIAATNIITVMAME